jgi:hypothetical protein
LAVVPLEAAGREAGTAAAAAAAVALEAARRLALAAAAVSTVAARAALHSAGVKCATSKTSNQIADMVYWSSREQGPRGFHQRAMLSDAT